jgi:hypothetical protein
VTRAVKTCANEDTIRRGIPISPKPPILRWAARVDIDLAKWPNLKSYVERVTARPKVQEALKAEGLIK